jgi:hypothetical protein
MEVEISFAGGEKPAQEDIRTVSNKVIVTGGILRDSIAFLFPTRVDCRNASGI